MFIPPSSGRLDLLQDVYWFRLRLVSEESKSGVIYVNDVVSGHSVLLGLTTETRDLKTTWWEESSSLL